MKSIDFPKMFKSTSTNIVSDKEATEKNLKWLLQSEKGELFGDPFYGIRLKRYIYEQNNSVLKDIIIDEIYTQLCLFMPQLVIKRNDITIEQDREKAKLYANIKALNRLDYTTNLFNIVLFQEEEV